MRRKPILSLFLMTTFLQIVLTGCGSSTNASSQPKEITSEQQTTPFDLQIVCIPYSNKDTVLQGVLSSLSKFINGQTQPVASYDITDDMRNSTTYLCLVDITFSYTIDELSTMRIMGECDHDNATAITKYAYTAKSYPTRDPSNIHKVKDAALFCNNADEQTYLKYLCSVIANGNEKDGYTIADFVDTEPLNCTEHDSSINIAPNQMSDRLLYHGERQLSRASLREGLGNVAQQKH